MSDQEAFPVESVYDQIQRLKAEGKLLPASWGAPSEATQEIIELGRGGGDQPTKMEGNRPLPA